MALLWQNSNVIQKQNRFVLNMICIIFFKSSNVTHKARLSPFDPLQTLDLRKLVACTRVMCLWGWGGGVGK